METCTNCIYRVTVKGNDFCHSPKTPAFLLTGEECACNGENFVAPAIRNKNKENDYRDIIGTCLSNLEIAEKYDINIEDVEEELEYSNIERCPHCDWWFEAGELVDETCETVGCMDCRPREEE